MLEAIRNDRRGGVGCVLGSGGTVAKHWDSVMPYNLVCERPTTLNLHSLAFSLKYSSGKVRGMLMLHGALAGV